MNRYELTTQICDMFGLEKDLICGMPGDSMGQKAKRPKNLSLNVEKAQGTIKTQLPPLDIILESLVASAAP